MKPARSIGLEDAAHERACAIQPMQQHLLSARGELDYKLQKKRKETNVIHYQKELLGNEEIVTITVLFKRIYMNVSSCNPWEKKYCKIVKLCVGVVRRGQTVCKRMEQEYSKSLHYCISTPE